MLTPSFSPALSTSAWKHKRSLGEIAVVRAAALTELKSDKERKKRETSTCTMTERKKKQ